MILYPNAKINIGLNILKKRDDGYHSISSVFYPLHDMCDILEVIPSDTFSFSSTGIKIIGSKNICEQAFELLKSKHNISNVKIHLHKCIPIGAGLGGGSSDAAFLLKGLNDMFSLNLSNKELKEYALNLGADCPFFIDNTPKYVEGVGEKMRDVNLDLSGYEIRIADPNIHISTKEAYDNIHPTFPNHELLELINLPVEFWKDKVINDFEKNIFNTHPKLVKIKQDFYQKGALYSSMSGSGSVIYAIFDKK